MKNLYLFHHDPSQTDDDLDRKLELAHELVVELGSQLRCHCAAEGRRLLV